MCIRDSACADCSGDGGDADAGDGGGAKASENERGSEWEFDFEEALAAGEAEGAGDLDEGGVEDVYKRQGLDWTLFLGWFFAVTLVCLFAFITGLGG